MINIYTQKELIPKSMNVIDDTESAFYSVPLTGTDFQRLVISNVEQGKYVDDTVFIDRLGFRAPYAWLSTGSKSLIVADYYGKDSVIDMTEVGDNAIVYVGKLIDCNIYINLSYKLTMWHGVPICVDGVQYQDAGHYNMMGR